MTINPDVNPNQLRRVYNCAGIYHDTGSTAEAAMYISSPGGQENIKTFNDMAHANNAKDWAKLLDLCTVQKDAQPEWLSPYLFCALAHLGLGEKEKAREMMDYYDKHTGAPYDSDEHCSSMAEYLHSQLP